jgi:hypothetical protein
VTPAEAEAAARLLERVLTDRAYRDHFRRNPVAAAREAGLAGIAEEMAMGAGKAMDTLDGRESRSSLAGVFMAAALEGAGIYDFSKDLVPHLQGIPEQVQQVLSRAHNHGGLTAPAGFADVGVPRSVTPLTDAAAGAPPAPPNAAGEFRAISPEYAGASASAPADAQVLPAVPDSASVPAAPATPANPADATTPAEPGGLEDPGGDTEAQADDESDGGDDDNDSVSDDPSDEQENDDEADDGSDGGDGSDGSDGGDGSDGSDGGDGGDGSDASTSPAPTDAGDGSADSGDGGAGADSGASPAGVDDVSDSGADKGDGPAGGNGAASADGSDSTDSGANPDRVDVGGAPASYPGDSAPQQDVAAWMAAQAQKRGLPPELPVMAALVESGLHNLDHGDADSLGFFQMRSGTWNQGAYAGYSDHPERQLSWFLDQAEAVKRQRAAAGQSVDDPGGYGDWIADIERPRADYRGRYQPRLADARDLLRQSPDTGREHAGDGAGLQPEPVAGGGGSAAGPRALAAVAEAKRYMGTAYQWGGSTPRTGFDCSGLVQWAYAKAGIAVPRTSEQQILASNGTAVDRAHLRAGDLVFFRNAGGDVHHVGISLGGDKFIDAPHTGASVRVDDLNDSYYAREFAGGRRFDLAGSGDAGASAQAPDRSSGVDPEAVRRAQAALARDAADAQRPGTLLFQAVQAQELRKAKHSQMLAAVDPTAQH